MAKTEPNPPKAYEDFVKRYPKLGEAWEAIREAGDEGPLDEKTARLVKLGIAIGAMREGAIHSSVRKALAMGVTRTQIDQVIALAAGTLGLPSTVAVYTWVADRSDESTSVDRQVGRSTTRDDSVSPLQNLGQDIGVEDRAIPTKPAAPGPHAP